jgi:hypothetical protein
MAAAASSSATIAQALRLGRGPHSVAIPELGKRLDLLLAQADRNQVWLASCLGVTPPAITNWKRHNRLPTIQAQVACRLLGIDLPSLLEPDPERFLALVADAYAPGSLRRWTAFIRSAAERADGLQLEVEALDGSRTSPPWGAVVFARDPQRAQSPQLPQLRLQQKLRFLLPAAAAATDHVNPKLMVLCVEDPHGWSVLCPSPRAPAFAATARGWLLPGPDRRPLELDPPCGLHRAVLLVADRPMPDPVALLFQQGPAARACDVLAAWLMEDRPMHTLHVRSFHVLAT